MIEALRTTKLTSLASPTIVISPDFLPELKKLPDSTLSMEAAVDEVCDAEVEPAFVYLQVNSQWRPSTPGSRHRYPSFRILSKEG